MPRTAPKESLIKAEGMYRSSGMSMDEIAVASGVSIGTIRNWVKKYDWQRDLVTAKRERFNYIMNGGSAGNITPGILDQEAKQDAQDMNLALSNSRKILSKVKEAAHHSEKANELKTLADTNLKAADTIRKIRGLDEGDSGGSFDDELLSLHHEITAETTH